MARKLKIAVTGGISSGKSVVCSMFESKGYPVIYADEISKEFLLGDEKIKLKIISEFGSEAYRDGKPDKKFLAEKVFSDIDNLKKINSILHPPTIDKIDKLMTENLKNSDLVFVEAALIYEAGMEDMFDNVLLVASPDEEKVKRITENRNISREDALNRLSSQIPDSEKKVMADFVINNDKSLVDLKIKAEFFLNIFEGMIVK